MADERDPKVAQRYRELPGDEPSRELDQHILAAAHRALDKPHAPLVVPAGRHRWYYSLAAAAIVVLAVAVTVHVERQQPDGELALAPPPGAPPPAAQPEKPAEPQPEKPAEPQRRPQPRAKRDQAYTPEPPPAASPPEAQPGAGAMADSAGARAEAQNSARRTDEAAAAQPMAKRQQPAPALQDAPAAQPAAADNPERELERIAQLRRQGLHEEADKALAEFRKRYPDYRISADMRPKVERPPAAR